MKESPKSWRVGEYIVCTNDAASVKLLNDKVHGPAISECITVLDSDREQAYLVLIFRVNEHLIRGQRVQKTIKFSEEQHAPSKASCLKLGTPNYYRSCEGIEKEVRDQMEGLLAVDTTSWILKKLSSELPTGITNLKAEFAMRYSCEPWLYCTSIYSDSESELSNLKQKFSRDVGTIIQAPDDFAIQLGVDFAINLNKSEDIELGTIWKSAYQNSTIETSIWEGSRPIDKIVHVYHGPVLYEDRSDVVNALEDFAKLGDWYRICFTKRKLFSSEMEYRFALSTLGSPRNDEFFLKISNSLRRFTIGTH